MSNPLAYLPLALAGANGTLNGVPVRRLVAAGVALLQRSAPLVRTLAGHRSGILLPPSPSLLVALAASDGRGAALLGAHDEGAALEDALRRFDVTAVFTVAPLAPRLPAGVPVVLLDDAPERATWRGGDGERTLDLAMHGGLHLTGEADEPGADEEVLIAWRGDASRTTIGAPLTHREVMARAVATAVRERLAARDQVLAVAPAPTLVALEAGIVAPLLVGGTVTARDAIDASEALALLEREPISTLVAPATLFAELLALLAPRARPLDAPVLQRCLATDGRVDEALQRDWYERTGVALRPGTVPRAGDAPAA